MEEFVFQGQNIDIFRGCKSALKFLHDNLMPVSDYAHILKIDIENWPEEIL